MKLAFRSSRFPFLSNNILFRVTSSITTQLQPPCMTLCECEVWRMIDHCRCSLRLRMIVDLSWDSLSRPERRLRNPIKKRERERAGRGPFLILSINHLSFIARNMFGSIVTLITISRCGPKFSQLCSHHSNFRDHYLLNPWYIYVLHFCSDLKFVATGSMVEFFPVV